MRTRIRNVTAVLALAIGLSLWAIPEPWGVAGIVCFLLLSDEAWEEAQRQPPYPPGV